MARINVQAIKTISRNIQMPLFNTQNVCFLLIKVQMENQPSGLVFFHIVYSFWCAVTCSTIAECKSKPDAGSLDVPNK